MAAPSVAAGAPPIILSIPYINSFAYNAGQLLTSTMQSLAHRLYQMDPSAIWLGSGGASDAVTESAIIAFYQGSNAVARSIDSLLLLNHNLKNFIIQYSTVGPAGPWTTFSGCDYGIGVADFSGEDFIKFLSAPITGVYAVQVLMYRTQPTANQEKYLGNFIAALQTFQLSNPPTSYKASPRQGRCELELADKTTDTSFFYWSDNSFTLYDLGFEFDFLTTTDRLNLENILLSPDPVMVYPEPGDQVRKIYLANMKAENFVPGYNSQWKGGGIKLPALFKQVGYL